MLRRADGFVVEPEVSHRDARIIHRGQEVDDGGEEDAGAGPTGVEVETGYKARSNNLRVIELEISRVRFSGGPGFILVGGRIVENRRMGFSRPLACKRMNDAGVEIAVLRGLFGNRQKGQVGSEGVLGSP